MNQKLIKTEKATILLLMLPEDAKYIDVRNGVVYYDTDFKEGEFTLLPQGNWQPLGFTKEVGEEVAKEVVGRDKRGFKYYWKDNGFVPRGFNSVFETALEAFHSLLQANEVYLVNPYGKTKPYYDLDEATMYEYELEQWQQAQQNTGNWYILKKLP